MRYRLVLALAALVALGCSASNRISSTRASPSLAPAGADVTFRTPDDLTLHGRLFGSGRAGVVLAHMFPADARSWYPTAARLADAGYRALAFDFRGYEDSHGPKDAAKSAVDLRAAYDFMRPDAAGGVALIGASMGGTAALIVAADVDPPAVVTLSAPVEFQGLNAAPAAPNIKAPVLLLASTEDTSAAESLRKLSGSIPNDEAKLFDGDAHGTNLLSAKPETSDVILDFLSKHAPA